MSLGVHFALGTEDEARLLAAAGDDDAVLDVVEDIEMGSRDSTSCDMDKAWDAIHRCLTDGRLEYVNADQVRDVAAALEGVDEEWLRSRYATLDLAEYGPEHGEEDFGYTWDYLQDLQEFYAEAAKAGRAVIFTVAA